MSDLIKIPSSLLFLLGGYIYDEYPYGHAAMEGLDRLSEFIGESRYNDWVARWQSSEHYEPAFEKRALKKD